MPDPVYYLLKLVVKYFCIHHPFRNPRNFTHLKKLNAACKPLKI